MVFAVLGFVLLLSYLFSFDFAVMFVMVVPSSFALGGTTRYTCAGGWDR